MITGLGTATLAPMTEAPHPKLAPCAFWESEKPVECTTDSGPFSGCDMGAVYGVCEPNWWLIGGVAIGAFLLLGGRG